MQARIGPVNAKVKTVASNGVGIGAVLRDGPAGLVEKDSSDTTYPGTYLALNAGTGERQVLYWGSGWARNDAWSWTPGQALYLSATPGEMTQIDTGGTPVGIAESATEIYFGQVHPTYVGTAPAVVTMAINGPDFEAIIAAPTADTISWVFPDASTDDTEHPDVVGVGAGNVVLTVTPASALTHLSLGYDGLDGGADFPGGFGAGDGAYALGQQGVTGIDGLASAPGLTHLAVSGNPLTALDVSSLSALEIIEGYLCGSLASFNAAGCSSIRRSCLEAAACSVLDYSDSPGVEDLRGANSPELENLILADTLDSLDHCCFHSTGLGDNAPDPSNMPVLEEYFMNNVGMSGSVTFASPHLSEVRLQDNAITSLDVSSGFSASGYGILRAYNNNIASATLTGADELGLIQLQNNSFVEAAVDGILSEVEIWGTNGGELSLLDNAAPSATGEADAVTLVARGWTVSRETGTPEPTAPVLAPTLCVPADNATSAAVSTDITVMFDQAITAGTGDFELRDSSGLIETFAVAAGTISGNGITFNPTSDMDPSENYHMLWDAGVVTGTVGGLGCAANADPTAHNWTTAAASSSLWSDDFSRADGPIGNGWASLGSATAVIDTNRKQRTDNASYQVLHNPTDVTLPDDYEFEIKIADTSGTYFGVASRILASGAITGAKFLWTGSIWRGGSASTSAGDEITMTGSNPGTWGAAGVEHTLMIRTVGIRHTLFIDSVEIGYYDYDINNQTGTGIATVGVGGNRYWDDAIVRAIS